MKHSPKPLSLAFLLLTFAQWACQAPIAVQKDKPDAPTVSGNERVLPKPGHFFTQGLDDYGVRDGFAYNPLERRLARVMNLTIDAAPALRCLAREYAGRFAADQTSPPPHAAWSMAHHCGYWSVPKRPIMLTAENLDQIEAYLKGFPDNILQGEVGIGVVAGPQNKTTAALLIPKVTSI